MSLIKNKSLHKKIPKSVYAILIVNFYILIGAIFFKWDATTIIFLLWAESTMEIWYNVLKMSVVNYRKSGLLSLIGTLIFYTIICGLIYMMVFLLLLSPFVDPNNNLVGENVQIAYINLFIKNGIALINIFIIYGIHFIWNFLINREEFDPTKRIWFLNTKQSYKFIGFLFFLMAISWTIFLTQAISSVLIILILLKTIIDIWSEPKEIRKN